MATLTIRNVDAELKERLRLRAARHGHSMEAELRHILSDTLGGEKNRGPNLAEAVRRRFLPLGGADEQKPAAEGTVEAWGRSTENPVGGWYGLKKGLRGRFGMYMPPLLEALGKAEVEHNPRNNRMRAV